MKPFLSPNCFQTDRLPPSSKPRSTFYFSHLDWKLSYFMFRVFFFFFFSPRAGRNRIGSLAQSPVSVILRPTEARTRGQSLFVAKEGLQTWHSSVPVLGHWAMEPKPLVQRPVPTTTKMKKKKKILKFSPKVEVKKAKLSDLKLKT